MLSSEALISLGALFLLGLAADQLGRMTWIPRVTSLLLCGLVFGASGLDIIPAQLTELYSVLTVIALTMVAFLLGSSLSRSALQQHGTAILLISLSIVIVTMVVLTIGLWFFGLPIGLAIILASIATATAPAATNDVIRQSGVDNGFTRTLSGIVAIDDAWGLIVFSLCIAFVSQLHGTATEAGLLHAIRDIGGAALLGTVIGLPAAYLTGRLSDGEPLETEALGLVFITAGFAVWFDLSFLIAGMFVGAVIVNFAKHHTHAFHEIEHLQWPFMVLFFILAGASLELETAVKLGAIGAAFIGLRIIARIAGGWIGATLADVSRQERQLFGLALLPQAGVAIGMALVAAQQFPEWASEIVALTVGTTVIFELFGPIISLFAIRRSVKTSPKKA